MHTTTTQAPPKKTPFTNTVCGMKLSPAGLGTVKFGRNQGVKYPNAFELPDDKTIRDLLALSYELGIRVLDTAPAYDVSELRLGKLLTNSQDWILATKIGETFCNGISYFDFSARAIHDSVHKSLKLLHRDHLDIVLIHSNGNDCEILSNGETVEALKKLKKEGLIRAIGLSGKTAKGGETALDDHNMDIAMITHNTSYQEEQSVIDTARTLGKGIMVKKAFASGHLNEFGTDPVRRTLSTIFTYPDLPLSVIFGTTNHTHLRENMQIINELQAHTAHSQIP